MNQAVAAARAVPFDFDFTLADSSDGITVCMNHALGLLGLPPAPASAIRKTIGLDLNTAFGILAGEEWRSRGEEFFEHLHQEGGRGDGRQHRFPCDRDFPIEDGDFPHVARLLTEVGFLDLDEVAARARNSRHSRPTFLPSRYGPAGSSRTAGNADRAAL